MDASLFNAEEAEDAEDAEKPRMERRFAAAFVCSLDRSSSLPSSSALSALSAPPRCRRCFPGWHYLYLYNSRRA